LVDFLEEKIAPKTFRKNAPKDRKMRPNGGSSPNLVTLQRAENSEKEFPSKKNNQLTSNLKKNRWLDAQNLSRKLYALIHPLCDKFRKIDFRPNLNYLLEGKTTNTQLPIH
jgi:hypothetical protein